MLIRKFSITIHVILTIFFIWDRPYTLLIMLIAPFLHYLVIKYDSFCYKGHCQIKINRRFNQQRNCQICRLDEWIRMRHCYKCNQCVHKYDHHCVLMGICIGEFNHKFYVIFLYFFMMNQLIMIFNFQYLIGFEVSIDQFGLETLSFKYWCYALSLIFLYFFTFMSLYLVLYHTYYMLNNLTTWEKVKRDSIPYLKNVKMQIEYPFSKGYAANLKEFFTTDTQKPIDWKVFQ